MMEGECVVFLNKVILGGTSGFWWGGVQDAIEHSRMCKAASPQSQKRSIPHMSSVLRLTELFTRFPKERGSWL